MLGPQTALYALLHEDHWRWRGRYTHEGIWPERAACRRDLDVYRGKACPGSGRRLSALAGQHRAGQRELSPSSGAGARAGADVRPRRTRAGTSTCPVHLS